MPKTVRPPDPEWVQQLHESLGALGPEYASRLSKARSYARNGAVTQLKVQPGQVSAFVQGGFEIPYLTRLAFPELPAHVWDAASEALAGQMGLLARLLAGTYSSEIDEIFAQAGERLLPGVLDLHTASICTCPDPVTPCKHGLALYLAFIERLRLDPGQLFLLRGRSLEQVLAQVGNRWSAEAQGAASEPSEATSATTEGDPEAPTSPLPLDGFFEARTALPAREARATAPVTDGAIVQQLGQPPFASADEDVVAALIPAYQAMTRSALRLASQSGNVKRARNRKG